MTSRATKEMMMLPAPIRLGAPRPMGPTKRPMPLPSIPRPMAPTSRGANPRRKGPRLPRLY